MTQPKQRIDEDFYPLTPQQARSLRRAKLTAAEWRIWSYLIELDPWGDRYQDLSTFTVMAECDVSKATYYRAIAKFQEMGLFDFQDKGFSFKNENGVSKMRLESQKCDSHHKNETRTSKMRQDSQKCKSRSSKPAPDKPSGAPQTIQTYSDFNQTLSDSERESFLELGRKKASQLPKPPELPLKWIEANWEELRSQWQQTPAGRVAANSQVDWTSHPDWSKWLDFMRVRGVPTFVALGEEWFDRKTRREIADWADERNLIWGVES